MTDTPPTTPPTDPREDTVMRSLRSAYGRGVEGAPAPPDQENARLLLARLDHDRTAALESLACDWERHRGVDGANCARDLRRALDQETTR